MVQAILPLYENLNGVDIPFLYSWSAYRKLDIDLNSFHIINSERVQRAERVDLAKWCEENCESRYGLASYGNWLFESEQDALMFKLAWGGARWTTEGTL